MHTIPMTRQNLGHCAHITAACYGADSVFTSWIRPNPTSFSDHWPRAFAANLKRFLVLSNQALRVMVSDDSDAFYDHTKGEEIIGYAAWARARGTELASSKAGLANSRWKWSQESPTGSIERLLLSWQERYDRWLDADKAYDPAAFTLFIGTLRKTQSRLFEIMKAQSPERGYIYLEEMHCLPSFQRKGVGKRLLRQGMDQATAENVPICLLASNAGEKLYSRMGFRTIGTAHYHKYSSPAMVWYPPGWNVSEVDYFVVDVNEDASVERGVEDTKTEKSKAMAGSEALFQ